jgi:DNA-binding CsgD family transcriptional regulator
MNWRDVPEVPEVGMLFQYGWTRADIDEFRKLTHSRSSRPMRFVPLLEATTSGHSANGSRDAKLALDRLLHISTGITNRQRTLLRRLAQGVSRSVLEKRFKISQGRISQLVGDAIQKIQNAIADHNFTFLRRNKSRRLCVECGKPAIKVIIRRKDRPAYESGTRCDFHRRLHKAKRLRDWSHCKDPFIGTRKRGPKTEFPSIRPRDWHGRFVSLTNERIAA